MGWDAGLTLAVVGCVIGLLIFTRIASDVVMIAGVTVLMLAGVLSRDQALSGLANEGMVTVGVLYIVVAGLE
nr:SLC13 family permease [Gammaproteobacteria bacterium]